MEQVVTTKEPQADGYDTTKDSKDPNAKEVGFTDTTTEEMLREGVDVVENYAQIVRRQCAERDRKEGGRYFECPLCTSDQRAQRANKGKWPAHRACLGHMTKSHKAKLEELKLTQQRAPEPIERIISVKRTMSDLVPPKQAAAVEAARKAHEAMQPALHRARKGAGTGLSAAALLATPESLAALRIRKLEDAELRKLTHMAWARGKKQLTRACRRECQKRNIALNF